MHVAANPQHTAPSTAPEDRVLLQAIRDGDTRAVAALYDRYCTYVIRVLTRVFGPDPELADLTSEVFLQAVKSVHTVHDPQRLRAWLAKVAIFTARRAIRRRRRRQWLRLMAPEDINDMACAVAPPSPVQEAADAVRTTMERMPDQERILFALRYLEGMEIAEIAEIIDMSLRTTKRRLAASERRFKKLAAQEPALAAFVHEGKWRNR